MTEQQTHGPGGGARGDKVFREQDPQRTSVFGREGVTSCLGTAGVGSTAYPVGATEVQKVCTVCDDGWSSHLTGQSRAPGPVKLSRN